MGSISTADARGLYTKMLIDVYKERTAPTSFLRSFFPVKESATKYLSIEVQRGSEKIAVDVLRGTEGNRNTFSKSTEKLIQPPLYREYFDVTEIDLYERLFGDSNIDGAVFSQFLDSVAEKLRMLQDKIERAYELQCSQVLETGVVLLNSDTSIDFQRKLGSLVANGAGNTWATGTVDPTETLKDGCTFLRQKGKAGGSMFNAIVGSTALNHMLNNTIMKARADIRNYSLDAVAAPQKQSVGGTLHGIVTAGSYNVALWSYPEYYDNASNVSTPYINPKKVIILPENPKFTLGFGAVPQLVGDGGSVKKGAYIIGEYKDEREASHIMDIQSAGIAIPTAVDQIYTVQTVA